MKTLFFDCETTGTDPYTNGLVQLSFILDNDGKTLCTGDYHMRPFVDDVIEKKALEIQNRSIEQIMSYPSPNFIHDMIVDTLSRYIDKYDKTDKAVPVAYCGHFDMAFLSEFFYKCDDKYLGSFITRYHVDPLNIINTLAAFKNYFPSLENRKLSTVCEYFGIKLENAHDALSDVRVTRELTYYLVDMLTGIIRTEEHCWTETFENICDYMRPMDGC